MASLTQTTKFKRKLRKAKAGKERKRKNRNLGTTPKFPIHTAEADSNAPDQVSPNSDS